MKEATVKFLNVELQETKAELYSCQSVVSELREVIAKRKNKHEDERSVQT